MLLNCLWCPYNIPLLLDDQPIDQPTKNHELAWTKTLAGLPCKENSLYGRRKTAFWHCDLEQLTSFYIHVYSCSKTFMVIYFCNAFLLPLKELEIIFFSYPSKLTTYLRSYAHMYAHMSLQSSIVIDHVVLFVYV